jgi:hypothetical protein
MQMGGKTQIWPIGLQQKPTLFGAALRTVCKIYTADYTDIA